MRDFFWIFCYMIVLLIFQIRVSRADDIYVSSQHGKDELTCGKSKSKPCRTIAYSVKEIAYSTDRIFLENSKDGSTTSRITTVFKEDSVIRIGKSLTIDVYTTNNVTLGQENNGDKTLVGDNNKVIVQATKHPALFYMDCQSFCIFKINNIVIRSRFAGLDIMGHFLGRVAIHNSIFDSKLSVFSGTPINKIRNINIELILKDCLVKGLKLTGNVTLAASDSVFEVDNRFMNVEPFASIDRVYAEFHNVSFKNGTFKSNSSLTTKSQSSFIFDGCTFDEFRLSMGGVNRFHVKDSRFKSNKLSLTPGKSHYLAFVQIYKAQTVRVTNTIFRNSSFGTLSLSYCNDVQITSTVFKDNNKQVEEAQGGGALLSFFSNIIVQDCLFDRNDAVRGGGTIHHVGGRLDMLDTVIYTSSTQYNSALFCQSHGSFDNVTMHVLNFVENNRTLVTLLPFNVDFKHMGTWQVNSKVSFYCPANQQVNLFYERTPFSNSTNRFTDMTTGCTPCPKGTYSFKQGYAKFIRSDKLQSVTASTSTLRTRESVSRAVKATPKGITMNNIECARCASEAICDSGVIRSKGNNWGYRIGDKVMFRQCPPFYCCSTYGTPCSSYNTCAANREGPLCGRCKPGHSEEILTTQCLADDKCSKRRVAFWFVYILASIVLTYVLMYFKDAILFIKSYFVSRKKRTKKASTSRHLLSMEEPLLATPMSHDSEDEKDKKNDHDDHESDEEEDDEEEEDEDGSSVDELHSSKDDEQANPQHCYHQVGSDEPSRERVKNQNPKKITHSPSTKSCNSDTASMSPNNGNNNNTISGIFKILVQFYQIESMLRVESPLKNTLASSKQSSSITNVFMDFILSIFNIKIVSDSNTKPDWLSVCPTKGMTVITKEFILSSVPIACLGVVAASLIINKCLVRFKQYKSSSTSLYHTSSVLVANKSFVTRLKSCVLQLFLIGYATLSLYLLKLVTCIEIGQTQKVLFIQGDIKCFQDWQYLALFVILVWVIPFPVSLYSASQMLVSGEATPNEFIATLFLPMYTIFKKIKAWIRRGLQRRKPNYASVMDMELYDRESLVAILSGPFRKTYRLGHPLIVWESVMVARRLLLCVVYVLVYDTVVKLYLMLALLILFLVHHGFIRAFTKKWLNIAETFSLGLLSFLCCVNFFWAYTNSVSNNGAGVRYMNIGKSFLLVEVVALLLPVGACVLYAFYFVLKKFKQKFFR